MAAALEAAATVLKAKRLGAYEIGDLNLLIS